MTTFEKVTGGIGRYLWAFDPYARMLRGVPAETDETRRLQALRVQGSDEIARANRAQVQEFIDKENQL